MIRAICDALTAASEPVSEALAYASYLSAQGSVQFAEAALARAKAELAAAITRRDEAYADIACSAEPPRVLPRSLELPHASP